MVLLGARKHNTVFVSDTILKLSAVNKRRFVGDVVSGYRQERSKRRILPTDVLLCACTESSMMREDMDGARARGGECYRKGVLVEVTGTDWGATEAYLFCVAASATVV